MHYLHDGHSCTSHGEHHEHVLKVSDTRERAACAPSDRGCNRNASRGHEAIPHGDQADYIMADHLHRQHDEALHKYSGGMNKSA